MTDELTEMERSNPITPDALEAVVAMNRQELLDLLEADSGDRRPRLSLLGGGSRRSATRVGYVGAMVAAAAAIVGIVLVGADDPPPVADVVGTAGEITPATPLVIDDLDREPIVDLTTTVPGAEVSTSAGADGPATTGDTGGPSQAPLSDGPFDPSNDLLSLHYDHADLDDGLSAMAAMEIATAFDLKTLVVSGTTVAGFDGYMPESEPVMRAAWGDDWLDANADRADALRRSVEQWLVTLDAGGRVWVAEGGVSDFTAEVVREIKRQRPNLDTSTAIHVVQHNQRNESQSTAEHLAFVMANTAYERIDDGNSANGTADLRQQSDAFETAALNGRHGPSWSVAFNYLPASELDFSDTVEVLHILGIDIDEVADPDDFARRFLR